LNKYDKELKYIKIRDLLFVILYGGLLSLLLGFAIGFISYYIQSFIMISFSGLLFFLSAIQIGKLVRKQYEMPHLVYIIITGVFLVIQAIIIFLLPDVFSLAILIENPSLVFDLRVYWEVFMEIIKLLFTSFNINLWLTIFIFAIGTYLGISKTY